jgi:hypothetical protein
MLILISCSHTSKKQTFENEHLFYNIISKDGSLKYYSQGVNIENVRKHKKDDILLEQFAFELNGKYYGISKYRSGNHTGVDGGYISYELDNLGVIYIKSTTWNSYSRLKSTNKSLDDLITIALENIILNDRYFEANSPKMQIENDTVFFFNSE